VRDHLDAFCPEDLVEGVAELGVAIVDKEPERVLVAARMCRGSR